MLYNRKFKFRATENYSNRPNNNIHYRTIIGNRRYYFALKHFFQICSEHQGRYGSRCCSSGEVI